MSSRGGGGRGGEGEGVEGDGELLRQLPDVGLKGAQLQLELLSLVVDADMMMRGREEREVCREGEEREVCREGERRRGGGRGSKVRRRGHEVTRSKGVCIRGHVM